MFPRPPASFCSRCGTATVLRIPDGDTRERACCDACGSIHYLNPRPVVGTIPVWQDSVLLCKRAIEPRYGKWTLPAGFMEVGETTAQGAARETMEEAGARVRIGALFSMLDVPQAEQVHVFFLAELEDLDFAAGTESLEVRLFKETEIPWSELAFRTVSATLRHYFNDRAAGVFGTHTQELVAAAAPQNPVR